MNIEVKMPDLATTDSEVTVLAWLIEVGQPVRLGQSLLEIETEKATMEVEAVTSGTLKSIHAQPGERVAVGQLIAIIENDAVAITPPRSPQLQSEPQTPPLKAELPVKPKTSSSMFARNRAARDETSEKAISLSATQRDVARRLQESKQTIPHFYLTMSANAEHMVAVRAAAASQAAPQRILWDAFFVHAVARALKDFDRMRHRLDGDRLVRSDTMAVGVAVDVDDGLYVVPVEDPLALTLEQVSEQITSRVEQIRRGDATARKLGSTSITITNLGGEGVESFAAIINPPEVAILAIGKIAPAAYVQEDQIVIQKRVALSLSVDHRIINGKYAAAFLSRIVHEIETL